MNWLLLPCSFKMTSQQNPMGGDISDASSPALSPITEPKRKVSILTDPPSQLGVGYDNPAFEGPRRKTSQVRGTLVVLELMKNN
jgi:hypothetical protein